MVTAMLLLMLHGTPHVRPALGIGDATRRMRLVEDIHAPDTTEYESWSRVQLRDEYDRLEAARPGVLLPVLMIAVGATGAAFTGIGLASALSSFFGVAVGVAVVLSVAIVICVGLAILGTIFLVRLTPERRAMGKQMDAIEEVYRNGAWIKRPGQRPCPEVPDSDAPGEPPARHPPPPSGMPPQVLAPGHPITLAVF